MPDSCCHLSRRALLRWAVLVATTPLLGAVLDPERAQAATARRAGGTGAGPAVPMNLELVTLTESSAVITWYTGELGSSDEFGRLAPKASDGEVLMGTSPATLTQVYASSAATPYHYAEITGLEPGQTYFYLARSGGTPATPAPFGAGNPVGTSTTGLASGGPFVFTTPQPPPGRFLFSVVLCNDLHLGETVAGLVTTQAGQQIPPGFSQVAGEPPYTEVMARALVADARARQAGLLLGAGDLSSEAKPGDLADAKMILDGFGRYGEDYLIARGNHDRSHAGSAYDSCRVDPRDASEHDCFHDAFFPSGTPTWFSHEFRGLRILGLDTYDKIGNGGDNGQLSAAQFAFVRETLAHRPDQPTLVFGHHPVNQEATITTAEPVIFDLDPQQMLELEALYAASPGVFLHHQAHTHRNKRTASPNTPGVVYQEVGAVKEYPGGFHLLRVHTGGYALNFYKTRSDLAREWSERTRQEDFGGVPYYVFGTIADRNYVAAHDFSGLRAVPSGAEHAPADQQPAAGAGHDGESRSTTRGAGDALAFTGGLPGAVAATGALAAAGGLAALRRAAEHDDV